MDPRVRQQLDELQLLKVKFEQAKFDLDDPALDFIKQNMITGQGWVDDYPRERSTRVLETSDMSLHHEDDEDGPDYMDDSHNVDRMEVQLSDNENDGDSIEEEDESMLEQSARILEMLKTDCNVHINKKAEMNPLEKPDSIAGDIHPFRHQLFGANAILQARTSYSAFRGIIIADPPGFGKTLMAVMAILEAQKASDGPCVYVCPAACCEQVVREVNRYCSKNFPIAMRSGDVQGTFSPFDLFKYRLIVTSYTKLTVEHTQRRQYLDAIREFKKGNRKDIPKRPYLVFLDGTLYCDQAQSMGPFIILDDAHSIKNTSGVGYAAVMKLRELFDCCVMITGTPLTNMWSDCYALLTLLHGHEIDSKRIMYKMFAEQGQHRRMRKPEYPRTMPRICQLLDAVSIRRPPSTIMSRLGSKTKIVREFSLPEDVRNESDRLFSEFSQKVATRSRLNRAARESNLPWRELMLAQQITFHPYLQKIAEIDIEAIDRVYHGGDNTENEFVLNQNDRSKLKAWLAELKVGNNCFSARIDTIIDVYDRSWELGLGARCIIMDESVCFLHIIEIALKRHFKNDTSRPRVFRFDGSRSATERAKALTAFTEHPRTILLCSRGAGGQGLNLQCANIIIRCGPWWNATWEEQALGRVYRPGQMLPVYEYEIRAKSCKVETYRATCRDRKSNTNDMIMADITCQDGQRRATPRSLV